MSRIALGSGGLTGGGELLDAGRGKGRREALGSGFIGEQAQHTRKGERAHGRDGALALRERRRRWLAVRACAIGGGEKGKGREEEGKGRGR